MEHETSFHDSIEPETGLGLHIDASNDEHDNPIEDDASDIVADEYADPGQLPAPNLLSKMEAILLIAILGVSSHFSWHLLGPLKEPIKKELDISNTGFGAMQSALSLLGTVMPIMGGLLVDKMGCDVAALISTCTILMGLTILVSSLAGAWFGGSLIGLTMIGVAGNWVGTAQDAAVLRLYPKAHGGHKKQGEVAFVFGVLFAIGKVFSFVSNGVALHLYEDLGTVARVFAISIGITLCSVSAAVIQWRRRHRWIGTPTTSTSKSKSTKRQRSIASLLRFTKRIGRDIVAILSPAAAIYLMLELFLGSAWVPFLHLSSNMIKEIYSIEAKHAAWLASITVAIPIVMYPIIGIILDKMQKRSWVVIMGTFCLFLAFVVMLYPSKSAVAASLPPILVSLSISLVPLALIVTVPRLVISSHVGVLLGLHRCMENTGAVWTGALAGILQDADHGNYHNVVRMFAVISAIALLMAFVFQYMAGSAVDGAGEEVVRFQNNDYTTLKQDDTVATSPIANQSNTMIDNQVDEVVNYEQSIMEYDTMNRHNYQHPTSANRTSPPSSPLSQSSRSNSNSSSTSPVPSSDQYGSQTDIAMVDQENTAIKRRCRRRRRRREQRLKQSMASSLPLHNIICACAISLAIAGAFIIFITVTLAR
ncbi:major facilitator superfamily domain-containing protein [Syncephalis plumigaleata]|nr:major facilitator superfamily domain-containing protein [Syncephalis plumigaleata]